MKLVAQGGILLGLVLVIFGIYLVITGGGMASLVIVGLGLVLGLIGGGVWAVNPDVQRRPTTGGIDRARSAWR